MNLIQTQQELNALPPTPESLRYLAQAAQGAIINVPPWLALARMNEINKQIEMAKGAMAKPPTRSLNEAIPQQLEQTLGLAPAPGTPPGQQGMPPQGIPPQGGPAPMVAAPQGMSQPQQPTQMMASGGIAGIPIDDSAFEYGSGGIVAFRDGGPTDDTEDTEALPIFPPNTDSPYAYNVSDIVAPAVVGRPTPPAAPAPVSAPTAAAPAVVPVPNGTSQFNPLANYQNLSAQAQAMLGAKSDVPEPPSPFEMRKKMEAEGNYGIDSGPIGAEALKAKQAITEARKAENARRQKDLNVAKQMAVWKAFTDAGAATKGQYGAGALMGAFGKSFANSTEEIMDKAASLRAADIKEDEMIADAKEVVQKLRRAQLQGDVDAEYKHKAEFAKIAKDNRISERTLMGHLVNSAAIVAGKDISADAAMANAETRAKAAAAGAGRVTPAMNMQRKVEVLARDIREKAAAAGKPITQEQAEAQAYREIDLAKTNTVTISRESTEVQKKVAEEMRQYRFRPEAEKKILREKLTDDAIEGFRTGRYRLGEGIGGLSTNPAPAKPTTRLKFDASGAPITTP